LDDALLPPKVVVFTGLPGTGKSTLAELVAKTINAPAFAGDWLMGALSPYGVLDDLDRASFLSLYHGLLGTLVTRQVMLGQSAIVDCLVNDSVAAQWQADIAGCAARLYLVECVCSDAALHRGRIVGRRRGIPGWHEVGWDHVERMRVEFPALGIEHLTVDAVDPLKDNMRKVLDYLGS
jgi:AAA domain